MVHNLGNCAPELTNVVSLEYILASQSPAFLLCRTVPLRRWRPTCLNGLVVMENTAVYEVPLLCGWYAVGAILIPQ